MSKFRVDDAIDEQSVDNHVAEEDDLELGGVDIGVEARVEESLPPLPEPEPGSQLKYEMETLYERIAARPEGRLK